MNMYESSIQSLPLLGRGKVRDIYAVGDDKLLIVTTDRLSAYRRDPAHARCPRKGACSPSSPTSGSRKLGLIVPNHLTGIDPETRRERRASATQVRGRAIVVKKFTPLPIEAVVRGYLEGSGWKEYSAIRRRVCGIPLPAGAEARLETAAPDLHARDQGRGRPPRREHHLRADGGSHRRGARASRCATRRSRSTSAAADYALERGIIIADTKFEFGVDAGGKLHLIDEALTPDSSRFWPLDTWKEGASPESFDKQYVRNWLDAIGFERKPPAPAMPPDVARRTSEKYQEAARRLMG